jgi:hypothetical protein
VENVVLMGAPVDTNVQAWEDARAVVAGRSTALHCTALHCTALHCTALHCTALHCTARVRHAVAILGAWATPHCPDQ